MNFVFFDIECAGVYKTAAKICAFGYVLCDENFNEIAREDILINPKGSFNLTNGKGEKGLVLPYKYNEFRKYPSFHSVYPKIRQLLEDKNNFVVGHSTYNDVNYLNLETRRFFMPSFKFEFSDTQIIYMTLIHSYSRQYGLKEIANDLDVVFTPHRAADDAYATMKVAEAMCRAKGCSLPALEKMLGVRCGKIENYRIQKPSSVEQDEYIRISHEKKSERSRIRREFYVYLTNKTVKTCGRLYGKIFNFSRIIEDDLSLSERYIDKIYDNGGEYSRKLAECNVYVAASEDDATTRTRIARTKDGLKVIVARELEEILK